MKAGDFALAPAAAIAEILVIWMLDNVSNAMVNTLFILGSGALANLYSFMATCRPGDTIIAPARFDDAEAALTRAREIYDRSVDHLRSALQSFVNGEALAGRVRAFYPFIRVHTDTVARADSRLSYGFVAGPGTFETTLTARARARTSA